MEKFKGKTKYLWILIITFIAGLLATSLFLLINSFSLSNPSSNSKDEVVNAVRHDDKDGDYTIYRTGEIIINGPEDWVNFVNESNTIYHYFEETPKYGVKQGDFYKYNYNGATIILNCDILTSQYIYRFGGTFDGQGHTIEYNGQITSDEAVEDIGLGNCFGLFVRNNGTIKNTKFLNVSTLSADYFQSYLGGIVGENNGTIENCFVQNVIFDATKKKGEYYTGTIAGYNNGTIRNCMVDGWYDNRVLGENATIALNAFVGGGNGVVDCIYYCGPAYYNISGKDIYSYPDHQGGFVYFLPQHWESLENVLGGQYRRDFYEEIGNASIKAGSEGSAWFRYKDYSHGYGKNAKYCVYLRSFMQFTTYEFTTNDANLGKVNNSSLVSFTVPSDYAELTTNENVKSIAYNNAVITATPTEMGKFDNWTKETGTTPEGDTRVTYTANFRYTDFELTFINYNSGLEMMVYEGAEKKGPFSEKTYSIAYNGDLGFAFVGYLKEGCFEQCLISFIDYSSRKQITILYSVKDNKKYINNLYFNSNEINQAGSIRIKEKGEFICGQSDKKYNITFG